LAGSSPGKGVSQDFVEAARLYQLAASRGNYDAEYNLGHLYSAGKGVAQDYVEAARLYGLAAAQGHVLAQHSGCCG
jgi:TPR repeat protein